MILAGKVLATSCVMGILPSLRCSMRKNARWFIAVCSEGFLWYIFPAECLVGVFPVELFFPAKNPKMNAGRWWYRHS